MYCTVEKLYPFELNEALSALTQSNYNLQNQKKMVIHIQMSVDSMLCAYYTGQHKYTSFQNALEIFTYSTAE